MGHAPTPNLLRYGPVPSALVGANSPTGTCIAFSAANAPCATDVIRLPPSLSVNSCVAPLKASRPISVILQLDIHSDLNLPQFFKDGIRESRLL